MDWKEHIKAIIKDAIANPPTGETTLNAYLDQKADLIMGYVPDNQKPDSPKTETNYDIDE